MILPEIGFTIPTSDGFTSGKIQINLFGFSLNPLGWTWTPPNTYPFLWTDDGKEWLYFDSRQKRTYSYLREKWLGFQEYSNPENANNSEAARLAETQRKQEEAARLAEIAKQAEADRLAEIARQQAEADRLAEIARQQAEADRLAEIARQQAEADRLAELQGNRQRPID